MTSRDATQQRQRAVCTWIEQDEELETGVLVLVELEVAEVGDELLQALLALGQVHARQDVDVHRVTRHLCDDTQHNMTSRIS